MRQSKKEVKLLLFSFIIIGIIGAGVKYFEYLHLKEINTTTNDIFEHPLKVSNAALNIKLNVYKIHRDMKDIVLASSKKDILPLLKEVDSHEIIVYKNLTIIKEDILGEDGLLLQKQTKQLFNDWKPIRDEVIYLINNSQIDRAIDITRGKGAKHVLKLEKSASNLYSFAHKKALGFKNKSNSFFEKLKIINYLITLFIFIFFILLGYYIIHRISKYIYKIEHLKDVLSIIRDVNQLIVREKNIQTMIDETCNILVSTKTYEHARIILCNDDTQKCPIKDFDNDKSALTIELIHNNKLYGYLTLSLEKKYLEDHNEIELLEEVASDIAYALYNRATEQKLIEQEELYDNIIDSVDNLIFVKDKNFVYIACNKAFEEFMGKSKNQILGKTDYDFFTKDDADFFREHDQIILSQNKANSNFEWLTYPDGQKVYLLTDKSPLVNSRDQVIGLVGNSSDFTEQYRLYKRLEEAQSLAKIGSWEYDIKKDEITASDEQLKIYGLIDTKMKLNKATFFNLYHPQDIKSAEQIFINSLSSKEVTISQNRIIRPNDGQTRYIEHRWKTEYDNDIAVKTIGTTQDITEIRDIENSLRVEKYRYEMAEKIAHLGSWEQNIVDNTLKWSDEVYRIFEVDSSTNMTFKHFIECVHPEDVDKVNLAFDKSVQERVPYHVTHRLLFHDGRIKYVLEHAKHFYDSENNHINTIGTVQDITKQKEIKNKLQQTKQEFEGIFNEAPIPMAIHNEDGKIIRINKTWEELTGYTHSEIDTISKWTHKVAPNTPEPRKEHIEKMYSITQRTDEGEFNIITKNGEEITWVFSSSPLGIIDNKRVLISTAMDITEIKKKDELMIVQSRHAAMGEMIGMIAHQWRQPIAGIAMDANNMLLDISLDDFNIDSAQEYSQSVLEQTEHLSKTIDDFRNFFKPDKLLKIANIKDILDETLSIIKSSLVNHNIEFKISNDSNSDIYAYTRELTQVFVNIITNAKDSIVINKTENAKINIKVYDDEKYVNTSICDNGAGIDESILMKIFDPYFTTKDEKTGTGLGLYMSKMIVEKHLDGKIEVLNSTNGVCFIIRVPIKHTKSNGQ